jgi:hypothetical protein
MMLIVRDWRTICRKEESPPRLFVSAQIKVKEHPAARHLLLPPT